MAALLEQAANKNELLTAITDALEAHKSMSDQALGSERVFEGLKDVSLRRARLYEALRERRSNIRPSTG